MKRGEMKLVSSMLYGMICYYVPLVLLLWYDWEFALGYFVYPFMESMTFLGSIAYLWHAWVDPNDPQDQYVNSVTIINGEDNIWNEDFHVVHHHAPHVHWTEVPDYFEKTKPAYAKSKATIFQNTEQGKLLYWMFAGKWDELASHFVDLNGKMTHEEKKKLLLERLSFTVGSGGIGGVKNIDKSKCDDAHPSGFSDFFKELNSWGTTKQRNWDHGKSDEISVNSSE